MSARSVRRRLGAAGIAVALAGSALIGAASARADVAGVPPIAGRVAGSVTADALPTAQMDGVAWTQLIVGNTVYVGGKFSKARPAGKPLGDPSSVTRSNLLAYDLRTGVLTGWAPVADGEVKSLAVSPDGTRIYAGGLFTTIDGKARYRIAAFSVSTGALISSFVPAPDYAVDTIVPIGNVVYVGGEFNHVGNVDRAHLAAFRATDGALTAWDPSADGVVLSMVRAPGNGPLVVGGSFGTLGGSGSNRATVARGLGAVDLTTGAAQPWATNQRVQNYGSGAAITHLTADAKNVYGSGYVYSGSGNLEGTFASNADGSLKWVEDCHGDSYGVYAAQSVLFVVGHAHACPTVGGFPETNPRSYHRALAFTTAVEGTLATNQIPNYVNWGGTPAPSLTTWFPDIANGDVTGQEQGPWTITGKGAYVAVAGEFPTVNGVAQAGLVRFAATGTAPNKQGPQLSGSAFPISASQLARTSSVRVSFQANQDPDNLNLTYLVFRDGKQVGRVAAASTFWNRPVVTYTNASVPAGTHTYLVKAQDGSGNTAQSASVQVTVTP